MNFETYNLKGSKAGEITLPEEIFGLAINNNLLHQVAVSQASNRRESHAHTKDRGEVAGTGKKPWKQKGTGRARAGSVRSPLWRKGGITFGPRNERSYKKEIPAKMRRKALFMALSGKLADNELIILDALQSEKGKTKEMAELFAKLPVGKATVLVALQKHEPALVKAIFNLKNVKVLEVRNLNSLDVLNSKYFVTTKGGIEELKKVFLK